MNGVVQGCSFIVMPCLHVFDSLAELGFVGGVGIGRGFCVGFFDSGLQLLSSGNVGDCGGALCGGGIFVGIIDHLDIEPDRGNGVPVIRIDLDGAVILESGRVGVVDIASALTPAAAAPPDDRSVLCCNLVAEIGKIVLRGGHGGIPYPAGNVIKGFGKDGVSDFCQ